MSRCTPRSPVSKPYAYRPLIVNVAELIPASVPGDTSSSSTPKPRRSAHRMYMRSSMLVQSCASVPPAPEFTVQIASRSSCSPVKSARSSRSSRRATSLATPSAISPSSDSSPSSRASSARVSRSDSCCASPSYSSTSSRWRASSVVTLRASAWSSQRSGLLTCSSSSSMRVRAGAMRRYNSAASTRRRRSVSSGEKSRIDDEGRRRGVQRPWQSLYFLPLPQ